MNENHKPQILLTNDDGILSPGLWAAAEALSEIAFVHVAAPREQASGMGRSMPAASDGIIETRQVTIHTKTWTVYSVGGSPAQVVLHAVLEILPSLPKLVVSGINYGENFGTGVTISGTVGAALEGAALGVPGLAVSLEVAKQHQLGYSTDVDFSVAAHFTRLFAGKMLAGQLLGDVDVIKVEVPAQATVATHWKPARLSRKRYYQSLVPPGRDWNQPAQLDYNQAPDLENFERDSDVYVTRVEKLVAVTPLSLDLTSRVDLGKLFR